jgi:hypothetical protein
VPRLADALTLQMQCRVDITAAWDRPFLIKREEFMRCVDTENFACRDSATVQDRYLAAWFHWIDGECFLNLPAFYLRNGRVFFINGRHRTVLLSRHLDRLPMALTQIDRESEPTLEALINRPLSEGEGILLPDLPIVEAISDGT